MPAVDIYDQPVCYLEWYFTQPPFLIGLPRFNKIVFAMLLNFLRFLDSHMCVREFSWTSSVILRSRPRSQNKELCPGILQKRPKRGPKSKADPRWRCQDWSVELQTATSRLVTFALSSTLPCSAASCQFLVQISAQNLSQILNVCVKVCTKQTQKGAYLQ